MNLGVYISLKNDDLYIKDVIKPVLEVFPQVKIIDLESTDNSIERIKETRVPYIVHNGIGGEKFTNLKNFYSKKHDWVVWIDSDEIYPVESLLKMKELIEIYSKAPIKIPIKPPLLVEERKTIRCSWKLVREENGKLFIADKLRMNGHKAFDSRIYTYIDPWPYEVLYGNEHLKESKKHYNGVWCWHAVLLERSSVGSVYKDTKGRYTVREKKRQGKLEMYIPQYEWKEIEKLPWMEII